MGDVGTLWQRPRVLFSYERKVVTLTATYVIKAGRRYRYSTAARGEGAERLATELQTGSGPVQSDKLWNS